jgi:UDP-N-acetylmuramate--alanine ligase
MLLKKEETLLHFVGIGGIGMSGIAEMFLNQGYRVSGSDLLGSELTERLQKLGVKISISHEAKNVTGASVVVISSAVKSNNPEVIEAKRLRVPVIPRAEMLGELMRGKTGIAVAGTHGKTTTTSLLATVLSHTGLDPTIVIGGKVDSLGGNAKLGLGELVVAEADESDGSFLHLPATFGVITNIDNDHLDHFGSLTALEDAFVEFVAQFPFYGLVVVCAEDAGVQRCMDRWMKPVMTYGFSEECDVSASEIKQEGMGSYFKVNVKVNQEKKELGWVKINIPGVHNVLNALAVIAIATRIHIPFEQISKGLSAFNGASRRFETRWKDSVKNMLVIDDYGHHPTEIIATLDAARSFWPGRILTIFQPHRYSRTLNCHDGFMIAFQNTDILFMADIYPAGEDPIEGVSAEALVHDLKRYCKPNQEFKCVGSIESAKIEVLNNIREGDLVLCLGAGSITKLADQLVAELKK